MIASRPSPPASCGGGFAGVPSSPQSPAASARFARACLHPRSLRQRCHAPSEFERDGEVIKVDDSGPLNVRIGVTTDLAVAAAVAGTGVVIQLFETWLQPYFGSAGPFLYYPSRRYLPAPLRAYVSQLHRSRSGLLGLARASSWAPHCGGAAARLASRPDHRHFATRIRLPAAHVNPESLADETGRRSCIDAAAAPSPA